MNTLLIAIEIEQKQKSKSSQLLTSQVIDFVLSWGSVIPLKIYSVTRVRVFCCCLNLSVLHKFVEFHSKHFQQIPMIFFPLLFLAAFLGGSFRQVLTLSIENHEFRPNEGKFQCALLPSCQWLLPAFCLRLSLHVGKMWQWHQGRISKIGFSVIDSFMSGPFEIII